MNCRFCCAPLTRSFVDLGRTPLANAFLSQEQLHLPELHYRLHPYVCDKCLLVQIEQFASPQQIFGDYPYFSSYSDQWLRHAESYAARMTEELRLGANSLVVEVASNDGYLLQYFQQRGVGVLGVEPAANVADVARRRGIPTEPVFFDTASAQCLAAIRKADLICANNVLAHVPDLNDFVAGLALLLQPWGTITVEFPHLLRLIEQRQFDTIYHEHLSYLSLLFVDRLFARHGLTVFDVDQLPTHGGSLRVHACHVTHCCARSEQFNAVMAQEHAAGLDDARTYDRFADAAIEVKCQVLQFLISARREGRCVAGYGAPAKGNTLLNYCGIGPELLPFTVDRSPHKQGRFLPGVQIPIMPPEHIFQTRPHFIIILPWNLREEIVQQLQGAREWGGRFVVPIPRLQVF